MTDGPPSVAEVTELAGLAPRFRALIDAALAERLGDRVTALEVTHDFHRLWNGGWRARVTIGAAGTLPWLLLRTDVDALLALPHPAPASWRGADYAASDGSRWTISADGAVSRAGEGSD